MSRHVASALACIAVSLWAMPACSDSAAEWLERSQAARFPAADMQAGFALRIERSDGKILERGGRLLRRTREDGLADRIYALTDPQPLAGLTFLSRDVAGKPADQWLYLPAYKRARRVAMHGAGDAFVGSDFIYADLGRVRQESGQSRVVGEKTIAGCECIVLETINADSALPYRKIISSIARDTALPLRMEFFTEKGRLRRVGTLEQIVDIDGHATPLRITMTNHESGGSSVILLLDVDYDGGLSEELFSVERLARGEQPWAAR